MNTTKTLGGRIKIARKALSMNQEDLAAAIGCCKNTISRYENDKRIPDATDIQKLCDVLKISPERLLTGERDMRVEVEGATNSVPAQSESQYPVVYAAENGEDLINVPLVGAKLSAGVGSLQVEGDVESYFAFSSTFLHRKGNPQAMVVMKVEGDSMSPEIRDEDMVLIDQSKTNIRLGRIYAVGFEDAIYLKRIDKEPGKILLKSVNPAYQPIQINVNGQEADSFRVIGQVLWVGREY